MTRAPRPRAYCTFCETVRTLLASGHPFRHNAKFQGTLCNGVLVESEKCEACDGTGKLPTLYGGYDDEFPCNVCKGATRIIK